MMLFAPKENNQFVKQIETLGVRGETLPPLLDWTHLPEHVTEERVRDFESFFLGELGGDKLTLDGIIHNIRYIDRAHTQEAFGVLANRLKEMANDRAVILVSDDESSKSRGWVCDELSALTGIEHLPEDQLGDQHKDLLMIVADDLMIAGEQSSNLVNKIRGRLGPEVEFIEAFLASTDNHNNAMRGEMEGVPMIRVFKVPMISETDIHNPIPKSPNRSRILTFFHHRVSDRFLPLIKRSDSIMYSQGKYHWIVDDMRVAPPYYPGKFTDEDSGWTHRARMITEN